MMSFKRMSILWKILICLLIVLLAYGAVHLVERLMTQELTRVSSEATGESVRLIWTPRLLRGDGICSLDLVDADDTVLDQAPLGIRGTAFDALQEFGQLSFKESEITVKDRRTGELAAHYDVRDERLVPANAPAADDGL
jgi:hypothetical protein